MNSFSVTVFLFPLSMVSLAAQVVSFARLSVAEPVQGAEKIPLSAQIQIKTEGFQSSAAQWAGSCKSTRGPACWSLVSLFLSAPGPRRHVGGVWGWTWLTPGQMLFKG